MLLSEVIHCLECRLVLELSRAGRRVEIAPQQCYHATPVPNGMQLCRRVHAETGLGMLERRHLLQCLQETGPGDIKLADALSGVLAAPRSAPPPQVVDGYAADGCTGICNMIGLRLPLVVFSDGRGGDVVEQVRRSQGQVLHVQR